MKKLKKQSRKRENLVAELAKLSVRARLVCRRLNVSTVNSFLKITNDDVCGLKNAGDETWKAIARLQKRIRQRKKQRR